MITLIIVYDIKDDKVRKEIRETIKDFGGERLQFSVYIIKISKSVIPTIKSELINLLDDTEGIIHFLYPCKNCLNKIIHISTRL